ncbi:MAG TPA: M20/M25/M40 family metallo-hydrolase [Geminicoccaceae bacterium]
MTPKALLDVRQMLQRLVGFDTTSRNSNLGLIEVVRDYLDGLGIASDLVFDPPGGKANLLATIGPPDQPGIVLSGRTDVVPLDGPIKLAFGTEAGRFAGRGIPTVVCGPGEIRVAHRPDEHVELAQLESCARFMQQLAQATVAA